MSACDINDNDNSVAYLLSTLPLFFWPVWLAKSTVNDSTPLQILVMVIMLASFVILGLLNTKLTLDAFYLASKSKGLPGFVEPIVRHMSENRDVPDEASADPASMVGYRYLVWRDPVQGDNNIITTEDIWRSVGTTFLSGSAGVESLKDMCLSYAFFMLILRRSADIPLHEISQAKTRRFVREGLLSNSRESAERVFRIIEVELHYLFDFLYTKYCVYSSYELRYDVGMTVVDLLTLAVMLGIPIIAPNSNDLYRVGILLVITIYTSFGAGVLMLISFQIGAWFGIFAKAFQKLVQMMWVQGD